MDIKGGINYVIGKLGEGGAWVLKKSAEGWMYIIVSAGKKIFIAIKGIVDYPDAFVLVGLAGMILVIMGKKKMGTKLASGSIIAYVVLKVVK